MSAIRRRSAEQLAAFLALRIPYLNDHIFFAPADPEEKFCLPSLRIIPRRFVYEPFQQEPVWGDDDSGDVVVLDVGEIVGTFELQIAAASTGEREDLEQRVIEQFASEDDNGTINLTVPSVVVEGGATLYDAPCSYSIDAMSWRDELAWAKHRYSFIEIDVWMPALVLVRGVGNIDELILQLTHDLNTVSISEIPTSAIESVSIAEDGSISNA